VLGTALCEQTREEPYSVSLIEEENSRKEEGRKEGKKYYLRKQS